MSKKNYMQKIFETGAIFWEKAQCICAVIKISTERPISLATPQLNVATDQCETDTPLSTKVPFVRMELVDWTILHIWHQS